MDAPAPLHLVPPSSSELRPLETLGQLFGELADAVDTAATEADLGACVFRLRCLADEYAHLPLPHAGPATQ